MKSRFVSAVKAKGVFWGGVSVFAIALALMAVFTGINIAGEGGGGPALPGGAVTFEEIPGSTIKRVILTEKAAERLGIETGKVSQEVITQTQVVGGRIIPAGKPQAAPSMEGRFSLGSLKTADPQETPAALPKGSKAWIQVMLSPGEWERVDKGKPAQILPLATRKDIGVASGSFAMPSKTPPVEDFKRSMLTVYYELSGQENEGLVLYSRVRVVLPIAGPEEPRTVVPYSTVYYDAKGAAWIYTNPAPLTFERQPLQIEQIAGNWAVLTSGPAMGASVVTVGAPLLYGAEVVFKK